jgi:hypothetical protein
LAVGTALALAATAASASDERRGAEPTTTSTATATAPPTTTSTAQPPTTTFTDSTMSFKDTFAPETTITDPLAATKVRTNKRSARVTLAFESSETVSTFACAVGAAAPTACTSPHAVKLAKGKYTLSVAATDAAGNADASPATVQVKVKRKRR